jgi:hypothetical protein
MPVEEVPVKDSPAPKPVPAKYALSDSALEIVVSEVDDTGKKLGNLFINFSYSAKQGMFVRWKSTSTDVNGTPIEVKGAKRDAVVTFAKDVMRDLGLIV